MEREEKYFKCFPSAPRQGKKVLIAFAIINIVFWYIYYNGCYLSYMKYKSKVVTVKPTFAPIYNVPLFHIPLLHAKDMGTFYIEIKTGVWCLRHGTNINESKRERKCICINNWFGLDCGIPIAVWKSNFLQEGKNTNLVIRRREKPRRIIISYVIDDFMELLDINVHNLITVTDLFLTIEEKNRNLSILNMFEKGYLLDSQNKIIPIQLNKNLVNINVKERTAVMLNELWTVGWKRLANFRSDDLFLFLHASSIISKDVLLFLKLYDNFPEPFYFELRPLLFKFWRQIKSNSMSSKLVPFKPLGCTFQFIASMCDFKVSKLFLNICNGDLKKKLIFEKKYWSIKNRAIGNINAPSGWQCNFCCKRECIQNSLKRHLGKVDFSLLLHLGNTSVTENFVKKKSMFNSKDLSFEVISSVDPFYAPDTVISNQKYSYLIDST